MPGRRVALAGGIAVFVLTLLVVGGIRWAGPAIYDGDGWYHVKYAEILGHEGISRTFPWFQESFLKDHFTDFNLLYHLILIPFTWGDPLTGARVASVLFAAATMTVFWGTVRALRVPWPALWAIGLVALAPELTYRLTYTRPLVGAIGLAIGGTGAILLRKHRLACLLAFVYAHWHCSYHLLPCVALVHDLVRDHEGESGLGARCGATFWTLGGAVAGTLLTPYFPNNLTMWWVANVDVLRASWAMGDALRVGTEMLPMPPRELIASNLGVFAVFAATLLLVLYRRSASEAVRTLLPVVAGFLVLTCLSQRFVEMWAPFTFLLAAVVVRDALGAWRPAPATMRRGLSVAVLVVAASLVRTFTADRAAAAEEDPPAYLEASAWMKDHVASGETIFNMGWDEFPELFYADGTHRYIIGQDPTFLWVTSPERALLWTRIPKGEVDDLYAAIHGTFHCRWVFVPARYVTFTRRIQGDARFHVVWSNLVTAVVRLDDPAP